MCSMSMNFNQKQAQSMKQLQRLIMSPQMQQALHMMQLPIMEISSEIELEMEQNPVLEYSEERLASEAQELPDNGEGTVEKELNFDEGDFEILKRLDEEFRDHFSQSENYYLKRTQDEDKLKSFLEQSVRVEESLFEHLIHQAKETFDTPEEQAMAEALIGNFDENGFLGSALPEIALMNNFSESELHKVLLEIQEFDPFGVGALSLQHSLLIQLERLGRKNTLTYQIIEAHYDDLLHNRIPLIKKGLKCSIEEINTAIEKEIVHLDLHPGASYSRKGIQHIVPDVSLIEEGECFKVVVNEDYIPHLRLNRRYLKMLDDDTLPKETKDFIKNKLVSAKWLLKNIDQRNATIQRLAEALAKWQGEFLSDPEGKLVPLTMKQMAEALEVHESTVARAVMQKYISTPRGVLPLRAFFTNAYTTEEGSDISSNTVREELKAILAQENKKRPLSDEKLSLLLQKKGISCARRTVAKYRAVLQIGNVNQRREF